MTGSILFKVRNRDNASLYRELMKKNAAVMAVLLGCGKGTRTKDREYKSDGKVLPADGGNLLNEGAATVKDTKNYDSENITPAAAK